MGHIHLGVLPQSRKWREVVALLEGGAKDADIVQASSVAAEADLTRAADDPLFVECVRLLAMIPQAARNDQFGHALRDLGLPVGDDPTLLQILSATGQWLDRVAREQGHRSDFGELARKALVSTLSTGISDALPGLFEATTADVQVAARDFSQSARFAPLARAFFTRLLSDTLSNWLDRTLSTHVGEGRRFANMEERTAFNGALNQYCFEATRIIREFAGGWYGKTIYRNGAIDTRQAAVFGAVAFKKTTEELRRKRGSYA